VYDVKRGIKGEGSAANVIGIIALLFIFYLLFIPPEERQRLLYETNESGMPVVTGATGYNRTLLLANIGHLDYVPQESNDHLLPTVILSESTASQVLQTFSPFVISHGLFSNKQKTLTFAIDAPDRTSNVLLVFEAPVRDGVLTVNLNGEDIYEATVDSTTPPPLQLRKAQLSRQNTLTFTVAGPGSAFWHTNEIQLRNVQVIGDISDITFGQSSAVFNLRTDEARNVDKATLYFYPVCDRATVGVISASINDQRVFSGKPDCENVNAVEVDAKTLVPGANTLFLSSSQGTVRMEQLRVHTALKATKSWISYFELNQSDLDRVNEGRRRVWLSMDFVANSEQKTGTVNVNGHLTTFDQQNATYSKDISADVQEGNNYLELRPESALDIVQLLVRLE
jgi:hypothetical protein